MSLMDPNFIYRNSSNTNVQDTWRKFGWTPKYEQNAASISVAQDAGLGVSQSSPISKFRDEQAGSQRDADKTVQLRPRRLQGVRS